MTMQSALIVDDHPLFCDALAMTLKAFVGIGRIDTADRIDTAVERLGGGPLPDVHGMEGLVRIRQVAGAVPVVVVSSMADARVIGAALKAGAAGFVPKHSQREVFRAAFDAVDAGRIYTPDTYVPLPETAPATAQEDALKRLSLLTRQQARILQLICEGKLNKQIAWELSIAETTVKAHVTAIMRKLGVFSRTQAVLIAREIDFAALLAEGANGP